MGEVINCPTTLISVNLVELDKEIKTLIKGYFSELQEAKVDLLDQPTKESLTKLYSVSTLSWGYFNRSQEIYRLILLQGQKIFNLKADFDNKFKFLISIILFINLIL